MASFYYYDQNPSGFCFLVQIRAFSLEFYIMPGPVPLTRSQWNSCDFIQAKFLIIGTESSYVILEQRSANTKHPV